jgi:hypothetical protein
MIAPVNNRAKTGDQWYPVGDDSPKKRTPFTGKSALARRVTARIQAREGAAEATFHVQIISETEKMSSLIGYVGGALPAVYFLYKVDYFI